jgi:hypothetical protein
MHQQHVTWHQVAESIAAIDWQNNNLAVIVHWQEQKIKYGHALTFAHMPVQ